MGRRSDHSREELREMALTKAMEIIEKEGLRGLAARKVAREIGYTIGTIYNLYDDLDDLILHMHGRTFDALHQALSELPMDGGPEDNLRALADGYIRFVTEHPKLWGAVFEHRLPEGREGPEWNEEKILHLLGLVERALEPLFKPGEEAERHHAARVLWSSLHGITSLDISGKLVATESVTKMAETLITNFLVGLRNKRN